MSYFSKKFILVIPFKPFWFKGIKLCFESFKNLFCLDVNFALCELLQIAWKNSNVGALKSRRKL